MSTPTRTTFTPGETDTRKHPIRGFFWGLMLGIGLALVAVIAKLVTLSLVTLIVIVVIGVLIGVLWGSLGPAKAPKGPPPEPRTAGAPEASRFDDFDDGTAEGELRPPGAATTATTEAEPTADPGDTAEQATDDPAADGDDDD